MGGSDCEHIGQGLLAQPANTLSSLAYVLAGLLLLRRALAGRHDLDLALIPAETINDAGLFLDDERFITVREALPMPVYPSYDFIDVLSLEGEGATVGRGVRAA